MDSIEGMTELKSPCCFSVREVERRDLCFLVHVLEITVQPRYNVPHYSADFSITRSCHGSQNDYFAICLL